MSRAPVSLGLVEAKLDSHFVQSPGVPGARRSEIRVTVFPEPRCPWGSSKRNLTSPEPHTHWAGCTRRPSKVASPWSRTSSGGGSVTPPLKTCSIHSGIGFYIRSSPRNTFVFYARDTVFRGDATVGLVRRQLLLDEGHHEGATSSLAAVATSFRLKRAMARIWFRATGEGELERSLGPGFPAIGGCSVGWASAIGVQRARHRQLHVRPVPLPRHLG